MASFCRARKISRYVVPARLYPVERCVGSLKFGGRRFQVCLNVMVTETFTGAQTYKINHEPNCNERSFIYLLACKI